METSVIRPSRSRRTASRRGTRRSPIRPEEELDPDFARGQREGEPGEEGRFSEGIEDLPDYSREAQVERRFSDGDRRAVPTSD